MYIILQCNILLVTFFAVIFFTYSEEKIRCFKIKIFILLKFLFKMKILINVKHTQDV